LKQTIYRLYPPKKATTKTHLFGHAVYIKEKSTTIVPRDFKKENVNPINFIKLKQQIQFKSILILDRTKPSFENTCVLDHVNRSGFNFLIGIDKINGYPMFPDMSNIYHPIENFKNITVHTLGPSRFAQTVKCRNITSEFVGLISPIWHYVGVKVFCKTI
tara:strand:- start:268 stop:747 length:480 start_codon:yes stop_codon:yes gene_type:complete